ncbi:GNAT family N-acetyltransferase [Paenibacillus aceris]|nr:GNAT family N-acetyltransferase [Paenibacillus aceris]
MNNYEISEVKVLNTEHLSDLLWESTSEGFRHIQRFVHEYNTGINVFNLEGEALFECRMHHRIIGICGLNQDPNIGEGTGRVRRLYILPEFRRYGVGREMINAVIKRAGQSFEKLVLYTDNPVASRFYVTLGFEEVKNDDKVTHCLVLK